jgi:hypothetical protein
MVMYATVDRVIELERAVEWLRNEVARLREMVESRVELANPSDAPAAAAMTGWREPATPTVCKRCRGKGHHDGCRCACMPDMSCPTCKGAGWYLAFKGKATSRALCDCNSRRPCPECRDTGYTENPMNGANRNARRCSRRCPVKCSVCHDPDCSNPSGQH